MPEMRSIILFLVVLLLPSLAFALPVTNQIANYTTIGYSMCTIPQSENYYLTGTLYKEPIQTLNSFVDDSTDIHFLVLDKDGNVVLSKIFDSGTNDQSYHITPYEINNEEFLLSTSSNGLSQVTGPYFSVVTYIVISSSGNIVLQKSYRYYDSQIIGLGLNCEFIGTRDIRPFKSIIANNQIYSCGMQRDFEYISNSPSPGYNSFIKTGFLKCMDLTLNPMWDKIVLLNDPALPCYQQANGQNGNDFDALEDLIEIPGYGISVTGTFSHVKPNFNGENFGVAWLIFGYNGTLLNDFSHYSTDDSQDNVSSAFQIYSETDQLVYLLENDEFERTVNVVGGNYLLNTLSSNDYKINYTVVNPDIVLHAYNLIESNVESNLLTITGMAIQQNPNGLPSSDFLWTPFSLTFDKTGSLNPQIEQSGVNTNNGFQFRGDFIHESSASIPKSYTPVTMARNLNNDDGVVLIGYQYIPTTIDDYGIRLIEFNNISQNLDIQDCNYASYECQFLQPSHVLMQLDHFNIDYVDADVQLNEVVNSFIPFDCEGTNLKNSYEYLNSEAESLEQFVESNVEYIEKIKVYTISGKLIYNITDEKMGFKLSAITRDLPSGLYIVKVNTNNSKDRSFKYIVK
jgi:hypothetical protein